MANDSTLSIAADLIIVLTPFFSIQVISSIRSLSLTVTC